MRHVDVGEHPELVATLAGALRAILGTTTSWVASPGAAQHALELIRQQVHAAGLVCCVVNTTPPRPHVSAAWSAARGTPDDLLGSVVSTIPEWTPLLGRTTPSVEVRQAASSLVWRRELDLSGAEVAVHTKTTDAAGHVVVLSGLYTWQGRRQAEHRIALLAEVVELIAFAGLTTQSGRPVGLVDLEGERHGKDRDMLVDALEHIDEAVVYAPAGTSPMLGNRAARSSFDERTSTLSLGDVFIGQPIGPEATAGALLAHLVAGPSATDRRMPKVTALRDDDGSLSGLIAVLAPEAPAADSNGSDERPARTESVAWSALTRREREVAELLTRGYRTAYIASQLFVGQDTVRSHLKSMFAKLDVHSQAELVRLLRDDPDID